MPGQHVAWQLLDGNTMTGTIEDTIDGQRVSVRRVDGTICTVDSEKLRPATFDDAMSTIRFFARIGA